MPPPILGGRVVDYSRLFIDSVSKLLHFLFVIAAIIVEQNVVRIDQNRLNCFPGGRCPGKTSLG